MLDVEAALVRACARARLMPQEAADAIAAVCVAERFDAARLGRDAATSATPVVPLVDALREQVGVAAAPHVHHGATSQDVLDTAAMLVARDALAAILDDAAGAADAAAALAARHRATPQLGRTLLQQAEPTTFGLKAAGWASALDDARAALGTVARERLAVQLGGPVGTLAAFGAHGQDIVADVAGQLGLAVPVLPWHADRGRPAALAGALGVLAGALAKIARDVVLLAQQEVGELREGGEGREARGRSSAMAHKRNPVAAVSALACAQRVPGLVATLLGAMAHEHERAAGAWQAEWETLSQLLRLTGSAAAWTRDLLEGLEVDERRMASNLAGAELPPRLPLETHVAAAAALVDRARAARRAREDASG